MPRSIGFNHCSDNARPRLRRGALAGLGLCLAVLVPAATGDEISEGELRFLAAPPDQPLHHDYKHLLITPESLKSGWIVSRQCHYHLDQVGALEVVFRPGRVRGLEITRSDNIEHARVEGSSVQLKNVGPRAVLCLQSENRALERDPLTGEFILSSGPFMRRFLDGYFPMQLSLHLDYPARLLRLAELEPVELRLKAHTAPGHLRLNATFEGKLFIVARFTALAD
jgi:hypothetical protein